MVKLDGTAVVITGATSGIGRATALAFAAKGASLALTARRQEVLDALADECRQCGAAEAIAVAADVADADAMEDLARQVVAAFGRVDVWVNNAGINAFGRLEEMPVEDWHRVVETNLLGCYHGARAALPWFREQGSGVLINLSSVLGKVPSPYQSAYVASKYAIVGLGESARQELRDVDDIHVCTILPGPVDTPLFDNAANYRGWRVKPMRPVTPAHRVARAIVRCATRPRPEVSVGSSSRAGQLGTRVSPRLAERVAATGVETDHFADEPAAAGSGNVHKPSEAAQVAGGWRDDDSGKGRAGRRMAAAGVVGAVAWAAASRVRKT